MPSKAPKLQNILLLLVCQGFESAVSNSRLSQLRLLGPLTLKLGLSGVSQRTFWHQRGNASPHILLSSDIFEIYASLEEAGNSDTPAQSSGYNLSRHLSSHLRPPTSLSIVYLKPLAFVGRWGRNLRLVLPSHTCALPDKPFLWLQTSASLHLTCCELGKWISW